MARYSIFHPKNGEVNKACEIDKYSYEYVTTLDAENFVRSFYMGQNKLNPVYAELGKRDTCVGDIIATEGKMYMVRDKGFKRIPRTTELYKTIKEIDEAIIEILSRQSLSEEDVQRLIDNCY